MDQCLRAMFQVKVPTWGTKSAASSFEVVSSPSATPVASSKKRQGDAIEKTETFASSAPTAKKGKHQESSSAEKHTFNKLDAPKGTQTASKGQKESHKSTPQKSGASADSKPSPSSSAFKPQQKGPKNTSTPSKAAPTQSKPQKPTNKFNANERKNTGVSGANPIPKSSKHPAPSKSKGKGPQKGKGGRKGAESPEDSIDELFGSYGGSDSDMSYTSDELEGAGIVIRSPSAGRSASDADSGDSDDSESNSGVRPSKKEEFSSDGFSSEEDEDDRQGATKAAPKLSAKQEALKAKLEGGRFRFINEKLYTTTGKDAFKLFQKEPVLFDVYHQGYRNQVEKWPENPLDLMINFLKKQPASIVVADFGCGEARLAQSVPQKNVNSFDLVARNSFITACDIAHVPLKDATVDVAVFCLSLMGTNVADFLREAFRVLKVGGTLKIAEVKSRFDKVATFVEQLEKAGFDVKTKDETNKMFILFSCTKSSRKPGKNLEVLLKPCIYKRR